MASWKKKSFQGKWGQFKIPQNRNLFLPTRTRHTRAQDLGSHKLAGTNCQLSVAAPGQGRGGWAGPGHTYCLTLLLLKLSLSPPWVQRIIMYSEDKKRQGREEMGHLFIQIPLEFDILKSCLIWSFVLFEATEASDCISSGPNGWVIEWEVPGTARHRGHSLPKYQLLSPVLPNIVLHTLYFILTTERGKYFNCIL